VLRGVEVSDIGFYGIVAALVGVAMVAIALVGLAVEGMLLWKRRRASRSSRGLLLGPAIYASAAIALLVAVETGSLGSREVLDDWGWLLALVALLPWIAVHWRSGTRTATAGSSLEEGR
jgi:hypothetical protein